MSISILPTMRMGMGGGLKVFREFGADDPLEVGTFTLPANATWETNVSMKISSFNDHIIPVSLGNWNTGAGFLFYVNATIRVFSKGAAAGSVPLGIGLNTPFMIRAGNDGSVTYVEVNGVRIYTDSGVSQSGSITVPLQLGDNNLAGKPFTMYSADFWINGTKVFDTKDL